MKYFLLSAVFAGILTIGCHGGRYDHANYSPSSSSYNYLPQGGSAVPNNQLYPDMFFKNYGVNAFIDTEDDNLSTFGIDVDKASYAITRRYLQDGNLPPEESVRTEEFINYFKYNYPEPENGNPIGICMEGTPSRFGRNCVMLRIGIQAKEIRESRRKNAILTFVIDTSGSMGTENRLELVKKCLRMLVDNLEEEDRVAIVIYHSNTEVILEHTGLEDKDEILEAIKRLGPSGSTYAEAGLKLGYKLASANFEKDCINRVILCSDGVANVGQTGAGEILKEIRKYAKKGIYLSTFGFGMGNYNDILMEQLADKGNGSYAYIDDIDEGRRVFTDSMAELLQVVAKDVKVQVEFNPETVRSYRLIGYENRDIKDENFRDEEQDAGEMNSGQAATALYELKLWKDHSGRTAKVRVNYKNPANEETDEISGSFSTDDFAESFDNASDSFKLAVAAAEFAEILRKSPWVSDSTIKQVADLSEMLSERGDYKNDEAVEEFTGLAIRAKKILKNAEDETEAPEREKYADEIPIEHGCDSTKNRLKTKILAKNEEVITAIVKANRAEDNATSLFKQGTFQESEKLMQEALKLKEELKISNEELNSMLEEQNTIWSEESFSRQLSFRTGTEYTILDHDLGLRSGFGWKFQAIHNTKSIYQETHILDMHRPLFKNDTIYIKQVSPYVEFGGFSTETGKTHADVDINTYAIGVSTVRGNYAETNTIGFDIAAGIKDFTGKDYNDNSPFFRMGYIAQNSLNENVKAAFGFGTEYVAASTLGSETHSYWNLACSLSIELNF